MPDALPRQLRAGGYPRPQDLERPYCSDAVSEGLARGLGYADWAEMDEQADHDIDAWGTRVNEGVTHLLRSEGVERGNIDDAQAFCALVRILDDAPAKAGSKRTSGWDDINQRLDDWIRFCGLSPETIRKEALA